MRVKNAMSKFMNFERISSENLKISLKNRVFFNKNKRAKPQDVSRGASLFIRICGLEIR